MTYGIGNPYQTLAEAIAHPEAMPYTNSDVNLDAATGKLRWYYQGVPNDFKDYDMQTSPISALAGGVPVVIGSGKMGYVYEMNASTGKLIWKTPVGLQNGTEGDSLKALHHQLKVTMPYTISPGGLGGVLTNLALASNTIYAAVLDVPLTYTNVNQPAASKSTGQVGGEVDALSLTTGKLVWHTKVKQVPIGATTVSNNLVFTTEEKGTLMAFNRDSGALVYQTKLPTTTNAPIAIAGPMIIVAAGGLTGKATSNEPQVVAYKLG